MPMDWAREERRAVHLAWALDADRAPANEPGVFTVAERYHVTTQASLFGQSAQDFLVLTDDMIE